MGLDPDVLRAKRRSQLRAWIDFANADSLYAEWRASEEAERLSPGEG
jgi:hypothetical protein